MHILLKNFGGCFGEGQGLSVTSWSMAEVVMKGHSYFDETASVKFMEDDSRSPYSLLLRWGEMASTTELEAEPPDPSELRKELLS